MASYEYEPGEWPKKKHGWAKPCAGFVGDRSRRVGKCPKGMGLDEARHLLAGGLAWRSRRSRTPWPDRIYVVHDGVVYRAVPTRPGVSYHAFPELPEEFFRLDEDFRARVLALACQMGQEREVAQWLSQ